MEAPALILAARITPRDDVVCKPLMSRPSGKVHPRPSSCWPEGCTRRSDAGIARGPGLLVAAVTAAVVFAIGHHLFPIRPRPAPIATPIAGSADAGAVVAVAPSLADATAPAADVMVAAKEPEVDAAGRGAVGAAEKKPADETPPSQASGDEDATAASADRKPIDKQRQADKDLAREAWRRNRPDVSVSGNKTSILVPIRGSIKGADFKIVDKRRTVVVTLPKSFKRVWIDQDEANAQPADGTKLRFTLSQAFDPQVEITDDFVRVTIRRPESLDAPAEDAQPRAHKRAARAESRTAAPDENRDSAAPEKDAE